MAIAALVPQRLTLVSLVEDARSPLLERLAKAPAFLGALHIPMLGETAAQRTLTAARIDAAIIGADRAVLLVAQGAGCLAAAWWARLSPEAYVARVAGALMIAPETRPAAPLGFASPRTALPFPSIVVGADDASQRLAGEWGSRMIDGPVPIGQRETSNRFLSMLARFTSAIVQNDVRAAERLIAAIGDH